MDSQEYARLHEELLELDEEHRSKTEALRKTSVDVRATYRQATLAAIYSEKIAPFIYSYDPRVRIGLNKATLNELVYSYFYDIDRAKLFHGMPLINEPKKAAYTIKWILKHKPIWYDDASVSNSEMRRLLPMVNEYYALRAGLAYTSIALEEIPLHLHERLLYDFFFRQVNENSLTLWFETFYHFTGRQLMSGGK